jgi:hypothetical protein
MSTKPVFILVTAETCPACQKFYTIWDSIKKEILNTGKVEIKEITLPNMKSMDKVYPKQLIKYIPHFPIMFIASRKSWENAKANPSADLQVTQLDANNTFNKEEILNFVNEKASLLNENKSPKMPRSSLLSETTAIVSDNTDKLPTYGSHVAMCKRWNLKPKYIYRK